MKNIFLLFFTHLLCFASIDAQVWQAKNTNFSPKSSFRNTISVDSDSTIWVSMLEGDVNGYTYNNPQFGMSSNSGNTWTIKSPAVITDVYLSSLIGVGGKKAYLGYSDLQSGVSTIQFTNDLGATWTTQNHQVNTFLNFVHGFKNTASALAVGDPDNTGWHFHTTSDYGSTWTRVATPNLPPPNTGEYFFGATYHTYGDYLVAITSSDRIFFTKDRGNTWKILTPPLNGNVLFDAFCDKDGGVYANLANFAALQHTISYTSNEGQTWTNLPNDIDAPKILEGIKVINETFIATFSEGWDNIPSFDTRISTNKGLTWQVIDTTAQVGYMDFSGSTIYGLQNKQWPDTTTAVKVYKYSGTPISGLLTQKPLDIGIELSPNPVRDMLQITVNRETDEDLMVLINSVSGSLMYQQVHRNVKSFNTQVSLENYPAGIYLITLTSQNGYATKKVMKQ
jgi:photosystem II stability/assembly factor-like uncharacterized protein